MERDALTWTQKFTGDQTIEVKENHAAHLLIEVDGFNMDLLMTECEKIMTVLETFETDEILLRKRCTKKQSLVYEKKSW